MNSVSRSESTAATAATSSLVDAERRVYDLELCGDSLVGLYMGCQYMYTQPEYPVKKLDDSNVIIYDTLHGFTVYE